MKKLRGTMLAFILYNGAVEKDKVDITNSTISRDFLSSVAKSSFDNHYIFNIVKGMALASGAFTKVNNFNSPDHTVHIYIQCT